MIQRGNTIVYKHEDGSMDFYWLVDTRSDSYVFFNWYGSINRMQPKDFWEMKKSWLDAQLAKGALEVFESLPEKYMDIFERQAIESNK